MKYHGIEIDFASLAALILAVGGALSSLILAIKGTKKRSKDNDRPRYR